MLPTESVVLISISSFRISCASCRLAWSSCAHDGMANSNPNAQINRHLIFNQLSPEMRVAQAGRVDDETIKLRRTCQTRDELA